MLPKVLRVLTLFAVLVCGVALLSLAHGRSGGDRHLVNLYSTQRPARVSVPTIKQENEEGGEQQEEDGCGEEEESEEPTKCFAIVIALFSLAIVFVGGHQLSDFAFMPEAAFAIIVGIVVSGVFYIVQDQGTDSHIDEVVKFDKEFFFFWLLPPIIFEAGYNMKRREFFANIYATACYAFIGTFLSTFIVGGMVYQAGQWGICRELELLPSLVFGALISATDPVTVLAVFQKLGVDINLFSMVFGESVLNDAVAIVLYRSLILFKCEDFTAASVGGAAWLFIQIFVLSFLLGCFLGAMSAITLKMMNLRDHDHHILESVITVAFPWASYFLAEAFEYSGIVAILFAGIVMANYTFENLSPKAQVLTREMYKAVATLAETFVFLYLGMSIFAFQTDSSQESLVMLTDAPWRLVLVALFACCVARFVHVLPLSAFVNLFRSGPPNSLEKISGKFQFLLWWSGLRGGVAFAIAVASYSDNVFPENNTSLAILQTTLYVAVFTIFVFGGGITSLARKFEVIESPDQIARDYGDGELPTRNSTVMTRFEGRLKPILTFQPTHRELPEEGVELPAR